jgi:oxygen-independent coproporphyrinogen-3 oxidase
MIRSSTQSKLEWLLKGSPYQAYTYSYPHKTAYRPLDEPVAVSCAWREESQDALFLYLHVPFCEFRCGFCNLFTLSQPGANLPDRYLDALQRQLMAIADQLPQAKIARLAIGGGTPTFLDLKQLQRLFEMVQQLLGVDPRSIPCSIEASPATLDQEKIALLEAVGVDRLSIGVQSFDKRDAGSIGRPQDPAVLERALKLAFDSTIPVRNLDLIYGGETQGMQSWLTSLEQACAYQPEEIYLYPLYVRPLTGLGKLNHEWDDWRLSAYRQGRDFLLQNGYVQVSMRMFQRADKPNISGPIYCCQTDGMIGLGCGARSYTNSLHYSSEYAVGSSGVKEIIHDYVARSEREFAGIDYGIQLSNEDRRRRFLLLDLLQVSGLELKRYQARFDSELLVDLPELEQLATHQLATIGNDRIQLTPAGLERSDAIGPWLYSQRVCRLMEGYAWR